MNSNMLPDDDQTIGHLAALVAHEFFTSAARPPEIWHVETLPYGPVLVELAEHCGDCRQCHIDGDGPTTCEEALALEYAGQYEIVQQFSVSLLN